MVSNIPVQSELDRIAKIFHNKVIFITGGTGFLGTVLIEKLLRCLDVKKVYILIREKKGIQPEERMKKMFENAFFDKVRKLKGKSIFNKCIPIIGDISLLNMGISAEDRSTVIEQVQIIFHSAATVRFCEPLKKAMIMNVRGVKFMLKLAKEIKNLMIFVHVSTAYSQLNEKVLYEKEYPALINPHKLLESLEWMDDDLVKDITPKILKNIPNTYAFTKNLGEALCAEEMNKIPLIIVRPSIVIPVWEEPVPGWTNNIFGPTGLLIAAGKGVLRTMYCKEDNCFDIIPVDTVINTILVCVWDYTSNGGIRKYYNLCTSNQIKVTCKQIIETGRKVIEERIPLNGVVWYPNGSLKRSKFWNDFTSFFVHYIPALIIDTLLYCLGYKPILLNVHRRLRKGCAILTYYANRKWDFNTSETIKMKTLLNSNESKIYKMDVKDLNYYEYFTNSTHAARLYLLNEPDSTIPGAKRHIKIMYWVDVIFKSIGTLVIFYLIYAILFMIL